MNQPKKTIRDIRIKKKEQPVPAPGHEIQGSTSFERVRPRISVNHTTKGATPPPPRIHKKEVSATSSPYMLWIIALGVCLVALIMIARLWYRADITVTPRFENISYEGTVNAYRYPKDKQLRFDFMIIEETLSEYVQAPDPQYIQERASGNITIINNELAPQRFSPETRFETPEGLIFKLGPNGVTVPARSGDTPGMLEVTVFAEDYGESYNVGLTDFVIPGWREINNPKFETQFARSVTPMTGGFDGVTYGIDPETKEALKNRMIAEATDRITKRGAAEVPVHFKSLGAVFVSASDARIEEDDQGKTVMTLDVRGEILLLHKDNFSMRLAREIYGQDFADPVRITQYNTLDIALADPQTSLGDASFIPLRIAGDALLEWTIDQEALRNQLLDIPKKDARESLRHFHMLQMRVYAFVRSGVSVYH
ncbi:MAG: hypothetical protein LRY42_00495 [Candidatus Pacebacteria bacterium]|nr:hypothetical protein [Candidatus Paceibacterota bacterium]